MKHYRYTGDGEETAFFTSTHQAHGGLRRMILPAHLQPTPYSSFPEISNFTSLVSEHVPGMKRREALRLLLVLLLDRHR